MARITRKQQKIFAESATNNGVFGSLQENNPTYSNDPDTIQGRPAYAQGWTDATYSSELLPPLEEFQALQYLFSRQIAYLLQDGVAEWNTATPYYKGSIVKTISGTNIKLFRSLADNNTGNQTTDTSKWALIYDSQNPYANSNFDNITDFSKNISNWSTNTTNCITEIPQDINLELSNGTLTLKAGSKVYMPNGSGVFDAVTITTDKTISSGLSNGLNFIEIDESNSNLSGRLVANSVSGAGVTAAGGLAYDTTANRVGFYNANGSFSKYVSFPIAIVTVSDGAISSIDQVFNGFGYIGSTIFVLPGVGGLVPNGRNSDGTLKNTSFVNTVAKVYTQTTDGQYFIRCAFNYINAFQSSTYYDETLNEIIYNNTKQNEMIAGTFTVSSGKVTEFNPKPVFHAVDYSDFKKADDENVKITGNQEVDGTKTLLNPLNIKNTSITKGTIPSSNSDKRMTTIVDKDGNVIGSLTTLVRSNGQVDTRLVAYKNEASVTTNAQIGVTYDTNNNTSYGFAPTPSTLSDNSTKIATTAFLKSVLSTSGNGLATISKAGNGYCKFTNGLIIQWGLQTTSSQDITVTLPTPFTSSSSYSVNLTRKISSGTTDLTVYFSLRDVTASNFNVYCRDTNPHGFYWLAIGY